MVIKSVIFDMNGVIVDDEPLHEQAFREVCKEFGINFTSKDHIELCLGRTDEEGFRRIINKFKIKTADINLLLNKKFDFYIKIASGNIKAVPHVVEVIQSLKKRYRLVLVTGATLPEAKLVIKLLKLDDAFEIIITAEDITHGKPDPEPYLLASKKLKLKSAECIVIEDAPAGVESAISAGMHCIGIHTYPGQDLSKADFEVNSMKEILLKINSLDKII